MQTTLLCGVGVAGILVVFYWMNRYFMMASWGAPEPEVRMEIFHAQRELHHTLEAAMVCLAALMLGLLCTIWLISRSRQATLTQINLNLLRLSEEMKQLRQPRSEPDREVHEPTTATSGPVPAPSRPGTSWVRSQAFWAIAIIVLAILVLLSSREAQVKLGCLLHHVEEPWNPFAKKVSSCAPYAAVRWRDSVPEVQVMGSWYELVALDDVPVEDIVSFCKQTYGEFWRKSFEEDLVLVLKDMGKPGHSDGETGPLTVRRLDTREILWLPRVTWTDANRQAILRTALDAWKAATP